MKDHLYSHTLNSLFWYRSQKSLCKECIFHYHPHPKPDNFYNHHPRLNQYILVPTRSLRHHKASITHYFLDLLSNKARTCSIDYLLLHIRLDTNYTQESLLKRKYSFKIWHTPHWRFDQEHNTLFRSWKGYRDYQHHDLYKQCIIHSDLGQHGFNVHHSCLFYIKSLHHPRWHFINKGYITYPKAIKFC